MLKTLINLNTQTEIPQGYRRIKSLEIIEETDLAFRAENVWTAVAHNVVGEKYLSKYMTRMIRKKKDQDSVILELMNKIGYNIHGD